MPIFTLPDGRRYVFARLLIVALFVVASLGVTLSAQTGPFLGWTQTATGVTAADMGKWQWELWVNGTGQLPLVLAPCTGTAPTFDCKVSYATLPAAARSEGQKTLELVAVPPTGIKSPKSSTFQATVAAAPTALRLDP